MNRRINIGLAAMLACCLLAASAAAQTASSAPQRQQKGSANRRYPPRPMGPPQFPIPENVQYVRNIQFCTGGGKPLFLDWYIPKKRQPLPSPVIIWIHGGGWVGSDKSENAVPIYLSKRGWIVASINYRLDREAIFPAAIEDVKCAIRYVRANAGKYSINPDKIGLVGSSAGAHLALLAGLAGEKAGLEGEGGWPGVSSRVAAVASLKGVSDFTVGAKAFQHGLGVAPMRFLGGTMREKPDNYRRASPITWLSHDDPPILLLHGTADTTVPYAQSVELKKAYDKLGLHAELVPLEGATHILSRANLDQAYQCINDFFTRILKP
jgi:acetyl esterase/lipase